MMNNPFDNPAFSVTSLTDSLNLIPIQWGRIGELGLFQERGVATTTVTVERRHGQLTLLNTAPRGGEATQGGAMKRDLRPFVIPHIPHDDAVMPEDVQDVRMFGSDNSLATLTSCMSDKLMQCAANHDITLEHLRAGAIRGEVLDADGSVIYDFFKEFDIAGTDGAGVIKTTAWNHDADPETELKDVVCPAVLNHIEDNLQGDTWSSTLALCSPGFWEILISRTEVKLAYDRYMEGAFLRQDPRLAFPYGGIMWEQYRGQALDSAGNKRDFIPINKAQVIPIGTTNTFRQYNAPASFNETANTIGLRRYAKQAPRKFERGWDITTEANTLPMCIRPRVLQEITIAA